MGVMKRVATDRMLEIRAVAQVTKYFFDRRVVIDRIGRARAAVLSKAGAFIRRSAKGKIRYAKSPSKPGSPPHAHESKKGGRDSPLRELIFFAYDEQTNSVVIGPMPFRGTAIVPRVLELGGTAPGHKNPLRRIRRVGDGGEIRLDGPASRTTKKNRFGAMVTYAKLRTQAQADRANRLQEELYGPMTIGPISIAARPYMGPALQENLPKLPPIWATSIS
jgi:hypothetical protein